MNKSKIKNGVVILAFIMLTANFFNSYSIKKDLENLRNDYLRLERNLDIRIGDIQNTIDNEYENMEALLKEEQSIFSETSINLKLQGNKIAVTMRAVPKEMTTSEKLIARVVTNNKAYEQEVDENNQAVMLVDIAEAIAPMFIIKSDMGVRQEVLEEVYTSEIFTGRVFSEWDYEEDNSLKATTKLKAWIVADEEAPPFTENDIKKAEFIIVDSGVIVEEQNSNQGRSTAYSSSNEVSIKEVPLKDKYGVGSLQGDRVVAIKESGEGKFLVGYSMDFSEYAQREDGIQYEIYFTLTTKDGVQYITPYNPIATFSSSPRSSSSGSGDEVLRPIFK